LNKTKRERGELIELIAFVRHYLYVPIHTMHFSPMHGTYSRRFSRPKAYQEHQDLRNVNFFITRLKKSSNAQANYS